MRKVILLLILMFIALSPVNALSQSQIARGTQNPIMPKIKANGSEDPITISPTDTLSVTIQLSSGDRAGDNVDWWLLAATPFGWFHYQVENNSWAPDITSSFQSPLFNLAEFGVLNTPLPAGTYTLYFGVDMAMNGLLDMDQIYYDSVKIDIQSGNSDSLLDSDGDGIPNSLEINGYIYDQNSGSFCPWNGDVSVKYFKSDPMQASTDGDPYSDSMEASGLKMPRSVRSPGNLPMVPACPNFLVKMTNYEVTLNAEITETSETVHGLGKSWNTDVYDLTETTDEEYLEASSTVGASLEGANASLTVTGGKSHSDTRTAGTVRSYGGDIMDSYGWSTATCSNPREAAEIKLTLLAKNMGTCAANNVQLTMNLKIGEQIVKSKEMEIEIYSLDRYNPYEWVESGIMLTYDELRLLETGAPVSLEVSQITADVVMEVDGRMVTLGKWENYMQTAKAVCANIYLDLGDGNTIDQLVYAGSSESGPEVTLKDAIIWAANGQEDPALGPVISFYTANGILEKKSLDGWYFNLDQNTYQSIADYVKNSDFNLFDTVLGSDSIVMAKAPPVGAWPEISSAVVSACEEKVTAYVDDYFFHQSLLEVAFVDKNGDTYPMTWDAEHFYFYCGCRYDYTWSGNEKIVAQSPLYDPGKPDEWRHIIHGFDINYEWCRFKDMGDGTVRDNETGLFWLKTADCTEMSGVAPDTGLGTYEDAKEAMDCLCHGTCGLTDKSDQGDWRLPTRREWHSLCDHDYYRPALSNTRGDDIWKPGDPFIITMHDYTDPAGFWTVEPDVMFNIWSGTTVYGHVNKKARVWPVRDDITYKTGDDRL